MNIMRRISKEYNEPFVDVVKGFAAMRCSKAETARTLGMSREYFYVLLNRFKLRDCFFTERSEQREGSRPSRVGIPNLKNQRYTDGEILEEVMKYRTSTEFANKSHISISTLFTRFGGFKNAMEACNEC